MKDDSFLALGIESSCDDSGVAIIDGSGKILANIVIGQNAAHSPYKGVVPEIAARQHLGNLQTALQQALEEAQISISQISLVTATSGPGLIGGVIVGLIFAKAIAASLGKPFVAVNHLEGHALTAQMTDNVAFPFLLLLASGGHCQFIACLNLGQYHILGATQDDSVGEAFDKVAKMLDLPFPGGPEIEQLAKEGNPEKYILPIPMKGSGDCNMSFSGLKTAVRNIISTNDTSIRQTKADIAASFQATTCQTLAKKTEFAIRQYHDILLQNNLIAKEGSTLVVAGGVAANMSVRQALQEVAKLSEYNFVAPPVKLCTDNAAMIAFAGLQRFNAGILSNIECKPRARWSLEELNICQEKN